MYFFSLKTWSILIFISVVVLVKEDIRKNGSFEESSTGIFLQDAGMYKQAFIIYSWADRFVTQTKESTQKSFPSFYDTTAEAVEPVVSTLFVYANATVLSTKKWCWIVTHKRTREYLPIVKANIEHYSKESKKLTPYFKGQVAWFLFESRISKITQEKWALIWSPIKQFVEETFSVTIDMDHVFTEAKSLIKRISDYSNELYEHLIDVLNLERNL